MGLGRLGELIPLGDPQTVNYFPEVGGGRLNRALDQELVDPGSNQGEPIIRRGRPGPGQRPPDLGGVGVAPGSPKLIEFRGDRGVDKPAARRVHGESVADRRREIAEPLGTNPPLQCGELRCHQRGLVRRAGASQFLEPDQRRAVVPPTHRRIDRGVRDQLVKLLKGRPCLDERGFVDVRRFSWRGGFARGREEDLVLRRGRSPRRQENRLLDGFAGVPGPTRDMLLHVIDKLVKPEASVGSSRLAAKPLGQEVIKWRPAEPFGCPTPLIDIGGAEHPKVAHLGDLGIKRLEPAREVVMKHPQRPVGHHVGRFEDQQLRHRLGKVLERRDHVVEPEPVFRLRRGIRKKVGTFGVGRAMEGQDDDQGFPLVEGRRLANPLDQRSPVAGAFQRGLLLENPHRGGPDQARELSRRGEFFQTAKPLDPGDIMRDREIGRVVRPDQDERHAGPRLETKDENHRERGESQEADHRRRDPEHPGQRALALRLLPEPPLHPFVTG